MDYISVKQMAKKWNMSERTVRDYCAKGKIKNAFLVGKTWNIPQDAVKPVKIPKPFSNNILLNILKEQKDCNLKGGIYHKVQVELTYNSNHIEGSTLTQDQTRFIFETNTLGVENTVVNVDDMIETANHFKCVDYIIENALNPLTPTFIKHLHFLLKTGTSDSRKPWFNVGDYKKLPNQVGGKPTCLPQEVKAQIQLILDEYNKSKNHSLEQIVQFHKLFEDIHPFQDGNGRVGRLIMFKECLKNNIVPFIIDEAHKFFYYRGLNEWDNEKGFLIETCLSCQDKFKAILQYFKIEY